MRRICDESGGVERASADSILAAAVSWFRLFSLRVRSAKRVSNHETRLSASSFETHRFAMLLRMRV
jgi:hypothetical protein